MAGCLQGASIFSSQLLTVSGVQYITVPSTQKREENRNVPLMLHSMRLGILTMCLFHVCWYCIFWTFPPGLCCRLHIQLFGFLLNVQLLSCTYAPHPFWDHLIQKLLWLLHSTKLSTSHIWSGMNLFFLILQEDLSLLHSDVWIKSSEYFWILAYLLDLEVLSGNLIFTLSPCYCCTWPHLSVFLTKSLVTSFLMYMYVCPFLTVHWNCDSNALDSLWDLFWKITQDQRTKSTRTVHALCLLMHLSRLVLESCGRCCKEYVIPKDADTAQ